MSQSRHLLPGHLHACSIPKVLHVRTAAFPQPSKAPGFSHISQTEEQPLEAMIETWLPSEISLLLLLLKNRLTSTLLFLSGLCFTLSLAIFKWVSKQSAPSLRFSIIITYVLPGVYYKHQFKVCFIGYCKQLPEKLRVQNHEHEKSLYLQEDFQNIWSKTRAQFLKCQRETAGTFDFVQRTNRALTGALKSTG